MSKQSTMASKFDEVNELIDQIKEEEGLQFCFNCGYEKRFKKNLADKDTLTLTEKMVCPHCGHSEKIGKSLIN